jgi:ABC-type Fe3+-citrate transport system substrate-binding protein
LLDLSPVDEVKLEIQDASHISDVPLLLPRWCINALARWASTISLNSFEDSITNTLKYAKSYASLLGKRSELDKLIQLRASRSRDLSARQAVDQIHSSSEITKRGWNALDERQREIMALNVEQVFIFTKRNGISADEVYAQMAEEIGIDERNVRRLVAYGRKIVRDLERCIDPQNDET